MKDYGNAFLGLIVVGIILIVFGLMLASAHSRTSPKFRNSVGSRLIHSPALLRAEMRQSGPVAALSRDPSLERTDVLTK